MLYQEFWVILGAFIYGKCWVITFFLISMSVSSLLLKVDKDMYIIYRKIPIISPRLIFVQNAFLLGLFSGELIFGGAYYWMEFCVSKWVGLDNKNSLKHYKTA